MLIWADIAKGVSYEGTLRLERLGAPTAGRERGRPEPFSAHFPQIFLAAIRLTRGAMRGRLRSCRATPVLMLLAASCFDRHPARSHTTPVSPLSPAP